MASQEILLSICDRCTTEVRTPLDRKRKKAELVLPQGWLHVSGNTATTLVFEMDLCEECKQLVIELAGKAQSHIAHSTTSRTPQPQAQTKESEGLRLVETG